MCYSVSKYKFCHPNKNQNYKDANLCWLYGNIQKRQENKTNDTHLEIVSNHIAL